MKLLTLKAILCLTFWGTTKLDEVPVSPHLCQHLSFVPLQPLFIYGSRPSRCERCLTIVLICISLVVSGGVQLLMWLLAICISSFKNCLSLLPICWVVFLLLRNKNAIFFRNSLYYRWVVGWLWPVGQVWPAIYFLYSLWAKNTFLNDWKMSKGVMFWENYGRVIWQLDSISHEWSFTATQPYLFLSVCLRLPPCCRDRVESWQQSSGGTCVTSQCCRAQLNCGVLLGAR